MKLIKYNRSFSELQDFFVLCVCGTELEPQVELFLTDLQARHEKHGDTFALLNLHTEKEVRDFLVQAKIKGGKTRATAICQAAASWQADRLCLKTSPLEVFAQIPKVTPKAVRTYLVYSRPAQRLVLLEKYHLEELRAAGHVVPKRVPNGHASYGTIEELYLKAFAP